MNMLEMAERGVLHMKHPSFNRGYDSEGTSVNDGKLWFTVWLRPGEAVINRNSLHNLDLFNGDR